MSYILTVHFRNGFHEIFLPGVNNRKVNCDIPAGVSGLPEAFVVSLEVWNGVWSLCENPWMAFLREEETHDPIQLTSGLVVSCEHLKTQTRFSVVVEKSYEGYSSFAKLLCDVPRLGIGSSEENHIVYNNRSLVSGHHAVLERDGVSGGVVTDLNSKNGTFVNGRKISGSHQLSYGDVIYILGLKIVYLDTFIAVNRPADTLVLKQLKPYLNPHTPAEGASAETEEEDYYQRSPRRVEPLDDELVEIEAPPAPSNSQRQPLIFTIGPAMTMVIPMGAGVLFTMWNAQQTQNGMTGAFMFMGIITSVTAAFIGVFWALTNHRYQKRMEQEREALRCQKYGLYLEKIRGLLTEKHAENKGILDQKYPDTLQCLRYVKTSSRRLWERNVNHRDFLTVRLGTGEMASPNGISIPKERFSLIDDALAEEPMRIKQDFQRLREVPIGISLKDHPLLGVIGDSAACTQIGQVLATQISAYHSYTDVRMVFLHSAKSAERFEFARWMPHTWSPDGSIRLIASDPNGIGEVLYYLSTMLRDRMGEKEGASDKGLVLPHYVVFIEDPALVENEAVMKYLTAPARPMGLSTVLLYEQIGKLPNNCTVIIQNNREYQGYYSLDSAFEGCENVEFDRLPEPALMEFARELSSIRVREMQSAGAVPQMLSFLDMYKTNRVEGIDIERRWLENRTFESMKAMIGYRGADTPLYLDVHEKYHGPHGLVAGTTGSGKSETLQTYILSLSLNYHPYEVSFILIDYKGGGMAGSFEKLPHIAGIITNLGGNQTNRALASINSEIKRRQSIFNEYKIKHIDTYIELFRSGKASEPMPHLLIIADEFAELKKEQPEFVRELVSASRVGRSLGVHLILATQKPSGVVDEEIWGNSKFRLCLRVQDKQDSNEMIRRPDAAFITNAGRGFFQVGNDEIFETFQSGWSGAAYEPGVEYSDARQGEVRMINQWGKTRVLGSKRSSVRQREESSTVTQLEAMVSHISEIAVRQGVRPIDTIWLAPLPKRIHLTEMPAYLSGAWKEGTWKPYEGTLGAVVGLVDDPVNQRQFPLVVNLVQTGHLLISSSSSGGKTTLLQTLLFSLATTHSPQRLNLYIADFGSRTLNLFGGLPHTGGIVYDSDIDKVDKLIGMLVDELNLRKRTFSDRGIGTFREYSQLYEDCPAMVLAIDNYASFSENCPKLEDTMVLLAREAASYGIYLVLTCSNISDVRGKIRQNISSGIGLQLGDRFEYEGVLNDKVAFPAEDNIPGRGLACAPKPLEFQTALAVAAQDSLEFNRVLKAQFDAIAANWTGPSAKSIPQVPEDLSLDNLLTLPEVQAAVASGRYLPLGYDLVKASLVTVDLMKTYCYSISGTSRSGKTNLMKGFMKLSKLNGSQVYLFDGPGMELKSFSGEIGADAYLTTAEELFEFMKQTMIPEFTQRNARKAEFLQSGSKDPEAYLASQRKLCFFIGDMTAFCEAVYNGGYEMKGFMEQMAARGDQHMIYLFACVSQSDLGGDYNAKRFFRSFIGWKDGVHLGGDLERQRILDIEVPMLERSKKLPEGYGHTVHGGRTLRIVTPKL